MLGISINKREKSIDTETECLIDYMEQHLGHSPVNYDVTEEGSEKDGIIALIWNADNDSYFRTWIDPSEKDSKWKITGEINGTHNIEEYFDDYEEVVEFVDSKNGFKE